MEQDVCAPFPSLHMSKPTPILLVLVGDDNPAWDGLFEFCSLSAGGSIGTWYADCHVDFYTDRK